jgi:peptidylprolyl isomerase/FKBP-type peptidyl-prolyl cis-trans isomerase SlpA
MSVKTGDTVRVHYTGKLPDGETFDSSRDGDPLEFTLGEERVIPGFADIVEGMEPGDEATEELEPERAYGERDEERILEVDRDQVPDEVAVGEQLEIQHPDGARARVSVTELGESTVTLDGNHPLAGRTLEFEIELVDVVNDE